MGKESALDKIQPRDATEKVIYEDGTVENNSPE